MVKLDRFDIVLNNPEDAYFAGQEISGKVIIEIGEPKKVNEILLELKGRARTYWTKHSGKSRKHVSHSEPYFLEQFNTAYTHKFTVTKNGKEKERVLPAGVHEIPFSYTLPKSLPSSFEGEFGHIRYTCRAICERPWDFDIVSRKAFTVIGIEDINSDPRLNEPVSISESNHTVAWCCRATGSITGELSLSKSGFTPGEKVNISYRVSNNSSRAKPLCLKFVQSTVYRAKTFAGHEQVRSTTRVILKNDKPEVPAHTTTDRITDEIVVPSVPPRLGKCKIMSVTYSLDLEIDQTLVVSCPVTIGSIPLLVELLNHTKARNGRSNLRDSPPKKDSPTTDSCVQVTITDESGQTICGEQMSEEIDALMTSRKRVRMPSSILSELYPSMPSPYYRESCFGPVDISDEKECAQYGEKMFAPKYPFYTD
uniref:Arrestin_C domain-containing protein n=1 Tax=Haemonchus contortus TaxID=6289 RepID=A0A7I4Y939_HAECO|nr:Arrestin domain containing protein [Haemonchus contortus]